MFAETSPVNILLVEDDEVDAKSVTRRFQKEKIGNPIIRARDGVEALEMLRGENGYEPLSRPYVIISDINMPRMDGLELLSHIRQDKALKDSVVFILTTSRAEADIQLSYNRNVAGYMVKDTVGKDFLKLVLLFDHYWRIVELPHEHS